VRLAGRSVGRLRRRRLVLRDGWRRYDDARCCDEERQSF
jgi:hypothetical protein